LIFSAFRKNLVGSGCKVLIGAAALVAAQSASAVTLVSSGPWLVSHSDGALMLLSGLGLMGFVARRRKKSRDDER
jgi:hypothetical protein